MPRVSQSRKHRSNASSGAHSPILQTEFAHFGGLVRPAFSVWRAWRVQFGMTHPMHSRVQAHRLLRVTSPIHVHPCLPVFGVFARLGPPSGRADPVQLSPVPLQLCKRSIVRSQAQHPLACRFHLARGLEHQLLHRPCGCACAGLGGASVRPFRAACADPSAAANSSPPPPGHTPGSWCRTCQRAAAPNPCRS